MLGSVGALAACAGGGLVDGEIDAAVAAEQARRPDDYVNGEARAFAVSWDGRSAGLLWGTWHTGYDEATVMPRAIRQRFSAASSVSVEIVMNRIAPPVRRAMAAVADGALLRADPAAVKRLDAETRRELDMAGLPVGSLEQFSLIGLARLVDQRSAVAPAGFLPTIGFVDSNLVGFAGSVVARQH